MSPKPHRLYKPCVWWQRTLRLEEARRNSVAFNVTLFDLVWLFVPIPGRSRTYCTFLWLLIMIYDFLIQVLKKVG